MSAQNTELAKVKARIKALMDRTVENGCTEQEAMVAATMAGRLMEQYSLNMSEIDVREEKCITVVAKTGSQARNEMWHVAFAIGRFCDCKVWYRGGHGLPGQYYYFGHETDAHLAEYLFRVVTAAIKTGVEVFKRTDDYRYAPVARRASDSFKDGMARRISDRLYKMKREAAEHLQREEQAKRDAARQQAAERFERDNTERFEQVKELRAKLARGIAANDSEFEIMARFDSERMAAATAAVGGSSLIVLKGQLVQKEYDDLGMKVKAHKQKPKRRDGVAYSKGVTAGNRVNLNRPLNDQRAPVSGVLA